MATDDLFIRLGLKGQAEVSRGLKRTASETRDIGDAAEVAGAKAKTMGAKFVKAGGDATLSIKHLVGAFALFQGAQGLGRLTYAGVKWGLSFNAQVESARLRFKLFTSDVDGLTQSVQKIDRNSAFNFADLADAAAMLGNSNVRDIPGVLQGAANAAAASGKGTQGLQSIIIALSQIQEKGRLSQEELNQLMEAQAPQVQNTIQKAYGLTAKQLQNIGAQGLDARKAIRALTEEWTTGKMAKAASDQTKTLGGQWQLLTGNLQKLSGAATLSLSHDLEKNVLPAANRASDAVTAIFGKKGLSNEEKLRQARAVIKREMGPIGDDLKEKLDEAKIPEHLGDLVGMALPKMAEAAADAAPHVVGAFVTAWMHSGPWAKLITALAIWKKLGAPGLPGGGGRGGLGGIVGKATPTPVFVTNWGGAPGAAKGLPGKAKDLAKTLGPAALGATRAAAIPAAGDLAPAFAPLAALGLLAIKEGHHNLPTRGPGASSPSNPAGSIPPPGFGTGPVGALAINNKIVIDGRDVKTANARSNAKQRARN